MIEQALGESARFARDVLLGAPNENLVLPNLAPGREWRLGGELAWAPERLLLAGERLTGQRLASLSFGYD